MPIRRNGVGVSVLKEFGETPRYRKPVACSVGTFLGGLSKAERERFDVVLADPATWSHAEISRRLSKLGVRITQVTLGRHRKGACACER